MSFQLSLGTLILGCDGSKPLESARDILLRDINTCLTSYGANNTISLEPDASLADESYVIDVAPLQVTVRHRDTLGGVYGLLAISERVLGIHPMFFWNDQRAVKRAYAAIPCGSIASPVYTVRYRGWFINDEVLLDPWKKTEEEHREVWRMTFETILRCGGNMVIPGTDRHNDGLDMIASDMGLILTQHHAELLGAEMFGRVWPELRGSYSLYPEKFEKLWRDAAVKYQGRDVLYAIGYRGQGDSAFWAEDRSFNTDEKRGAEISRVMQRQMEIVREISPNAKFCTNLYGEMTHLYRSGYLHVPDEVIKVWADNGYGRMLSRRQGGSNPRVNAMPCQEQGENGIYFHASFYDLQAANHITQIQIPPSELSRELKEVLANGADAYWIINCGCVKPHVYILDLIRELWQNGDVDVDAHAAAYAEKYFGDPRVGKLLTGYADCAVSCGEYPDNLAGDQYYHYTLRALCTALMRGDKGEVLSLRWTESGDIFTQAAHIAERCGEKLDAWRCFIEQVRELSKQLTADARLLLEDTLLMNATLHLTGCESLCDFAQAIKAYQASAFDSAFYYVGKALEATEAGYNALRGVEHGGWDGYYRNDCFVNVRLTADILRALRSWLRVCYDGPNYLGWERKWLMKPEDVRICLQTHRRIQYSDDELYAKLKALGTLE